MSGDHAAILLGVVSLLVLLTGDLLRNRRRKNEDRKLREEFETKDSNRK